MALAAVRDAPLHVVLVEPQIPPNTGNVARLCAATGCALHLVEPLGFRIDDRELKRAGLDYWDALGVIVHPSLDALLDVFPPHRLWLLSTRATRSYADAEFAPATRWCSAKKRRAYRKRSSTPSPSGHCASRCAQAQCVRSTCRPPPVS